MDKTHYRLLIRTYYNGPTHYGVTHNGDFKEREKRKYTREIYIWVNLSAMLILTLDLPQTAALMGQNIIM